MAFNYRFLSIIKAFLIDVDPAGVHSFVPVLIAVLTFTARSNPSTVTWSPDCYDHFA